MGRTEEGVNNEVREPERTRPRLPSLMPVSATGASSSQDPIPVIPSDTPRGPMFPPPPPPPSTLQPRWAPWSPEWFLYWMAGRVTSRLERGQMSDEQRRRLLGATLAALELNHSTRTRQRAHDFCFNMTDLSPKKFPTVLWTRRRSLTSRFGERCWRERVGGEDRGYFDPDNIPWRNYGTENREANDSNEENNETSENEQESFESEDTRVARYLNSGLEEVSDHEMWMPLHHWSSESENDGDETTNNDATASSTAAMVTTHEDNDGGEPEDEPRTNVEFILHDVERGCVRQLNHASLNVDTTRH